MYIEGWFNRFRETGLDINTNVKHILCDMSINVIPINHIQIRQHE